MRIWAHGHAQMEVQPGLHRVWQAADCLIRQLDSRKGQPAAAKQHESTDSQSPHVTCTMTPVVSAHYDSQLADKQQCIYRSRRQGAVR